MKKNLIALLLILLAVLGGVGELRGWLLPTISWPFTVSRELSFLSMGDEYTPYLAVQGRVHWFGWLCMLGLGVVGLYLLVRSSFALRLPPHYRVRIERFRQLRRGYVSLIILVVFMILAALDQSLVGRRALFVSHEGQWYFPAFQRAVIPGETFGLTGDEAQAEANYRLLKRRAGEPGMPDLVLMPLVPYNPTMDAVPFPIENLHEQDGILRDEQGVPFNGQACRLYEDGQPHLRIRYRRGVPDGYAQGWTPDRREVYGATYKEGKLVEEHFSDQGYLKDFLELTDATKLCRVHYHPAPPLTGDHLLGTTAQGADMLAYLYGGLQVNIKAALFYLPVTYAIGLTMGMLMGYFGGKLDLFTQRCIEILSQLPFLYVVMIFSDMVPQSWRGMFLILALLSAFGWMHMTYMVRAATMKEKSREYVAAARVMGAGSFHILTKHILPNLTSIIVTLAPFSIAGVILIIASLDYMGFGVPDTCASWGRLLNEGLRRLSSPWLVSCAFLALVSSLLVITFIGEAIREALDPRRHTYYE